MKMKTTFGKHNDKAKKVFVENIRSILDIKTKEAEKLLDYAVKLGLMDKWVAIKCPRCRALVEYFAIGFPLPEKASHYLCSNMPDDSDEVEFEFKPKPTDCIIYYTPK